VRYKMLRAADCKIQGGGPAVSVWSERSEVSILVYYIRQLHDLLSQYTIQYHTYYYKLFSSKLFKKLHHVKGHVKIFMRLFLLMYIIRFKYNYIMVKLYSSSDVN
jgi:hypothetical protein